MDETNGIYVFQNGKDGWAQSDEPVDIIGVNPEGKIQWTTKKFPCINWKTFKSQNLYLTEKVPTESGKGEDDKSSFILTRNDPKTLKNIWSFNVFGYPHILSETKDRLIIYTIQGVFCIGTAKGDLIWKYADENKSHYGTELVNNMIMLGQYKKSDDYSCDGAKIVVLNPDDGKVLFEKVTNKGVSWELDKNSLFLISYWYDGDSYQEITKFEVNGWKELWTVSGKGEARLVGDRTIIADSGKHVEWFDSGKPVGKIDLQLQDEDLTGMPFNNSVDWHNDFLFIKRSSALYIVNAKTSEVAAKIYDGKYSSSLDITHEKVNYHESYRTPCFFDEHVFVGVGRKLVCMSMVK